MENRNEYGENGNLKYDKEYRNMKKCNRVSRFYV